MHANEYSHLRPTCRHTKNGHGTHTHTPHMHSILLGPGTTHPQRGSQRPIPELNPLRSAWGQEDHPVPAAAEKINSPRPRPGGQLILTAPGPEQRTENRGCERKKKKRETPCFTPTRLKCSVGVCCSNVLLKQGCFKTGRGTLHKLVSARPLLEPSMSMCNLKWEVGTGTRGKAEWTDRPSGCHSVCPPPRPSMYVSCDGK